MASLGWSLVWGPGATCFSEGLGLAVLPVSGDTLPSSLALLTVWSLLLFVSNISRVFSIACSSDSVVVVDITISESVHFGDLLLISLFVHVAFLLLLEKRKLK